MTSDNRFHGGLNLKPFGGNMNIKRITSFVLSFVMLFTLLFIALPETEVSAATKAELEQQIEQINGQIAANKDKLNELKDKKESQQEYLETLENQIDTVEEKATNLQVQVSTIDGEIAKLDKQINQLTKEIRQTKKQINKAEDDIVTMEETIENTSDRMAQKLRASYMKGSESTLQILMGSDSLASFLTRLEMMKRTSEKDKKDIEDFRDTVVTLKETRKQLIDDKNALAEKRETRQESKDDLVVKRTELKKKESEYKRTVSQLEKQYGAIDAYVAELDKSSAVYENYIAKLNKEKAAADAEIDRILKEYYATTQATTQSSGSAGGNYNTNATWSWPLGSASCYISSHYGYRNPGISGWGFHGGTDITGGGIHGKPVYATRAGKVITAVTSNSGYGIYVLIDHGDGYSSLYAHMSARYVNSGDSVSKGQMIGRVGSTGNSTGPHLHFEIRYYGEKKNPMNYVKKP